MGNKMLIDATHPEETRVVVLRGNRVEEFDYELASRKQLRGNIYLAKVTRVEPSLQAAFVNYGGNRHGFLAFNEIHPDYYQLPMAERQALKHEEERDTRAESAAYEEAALKGGPASHNDEPVSGSEASAAEAGSEGGSLAHGAMAEYGAPFADEASSVEDIDPSQQTAALEAALPAAKYSANLYEDNGSDQPEVGNWPGSQVETINSDHGNPSDDDDEDEAPPAGREAKHHGRRRNGGEEAQEAEQVELVGSEDALEELPQRNRRRRRIYKIQEVIKRGQIILVQVVKEERGNKGAALTTYLSLAGRYTVLMPNTASGGGISRKISSPGDRKRLREIANELDVSEGMGLIIRTAGAARTKTEVKRDYEYLLRLWENVRDLTLKSTAPSLVYEEGDLIKRSIRDLYNREIDEVLVAGDDAYRDAKDFMRMLMPSHAKNVQPYKDPEPVFARYEVERQLNAMFSPQVTLPSGGYIIINQTEALVAIDINSGKSTREFSIEETALKTNMEAAEEIARQLRLRDLAGLIVADFIDMEEKRNNRSVERKLKECLRNDRARIQVGRISHFGLLEMSRQRLRTGMVEGSTTQCQHCQGTGVVRSTESVALSVLRGLEDWLRTNQPCSLNAVTSTEVALYILNQKRGYLNDIEARYAVSLSVTASDRVHGAHFYIEKVSVIAAATGSPVSAAVTQVDRIQPFEQEPAEATDDQGQRNSRRKRRRRRGRGDDDKDNRESFSARDDAIASARATTASRTRRISKKSPRPRMRKARAASKRKTAARMAASNAGVRAGGAGAADGSIGMGVPAEVGAANEDAAGIAASDEADTPSITAAETDAADRFTSRMSAISRMSAQPPKLLYRAERCGAMTRSAGRRPHRAPIVRRFAMMNARMTTEPQPATAQRSQTGKPVPGTLRRAVAKSWRLLRKLMPS